MTGAEIVGELLRADPAFTAIVPIERIKLGKLPIDIGLPAIVVRVISLTDRQPLKRGARTRSSSRIAVTVRAANVRDQRLVIGLARDCCAGRVGDFAGAERVSILTAGLGPDVDGPGDSFEQTQDFRVSFDA